MLVLGFVTQVIVGALGPVPIAAVGFANSLWFIFLITLGALGVSVTILTARAYGANRKHEMGTTVSSAVIVAVLLGAVFATVMSVWPGELLRLTGASPSVAAEGSPYLRLIAIALVPNLFSTVLSGVLRSTGHPRAPMVATFITSGLGALLAFVFVHGAGPIASMGVVGAGLATLIAALLKAVILAPLVFRDVIGWETPSRAEFVRVLRPLFVLAIPLGLTELVWTLGTFLYNVVFQRLGDEPLAAAQIVSTLEGIFIVGSIGLMTAATALIGKAVGQADLAAVYGWIHRLQRAGIVTSLVFGALFALAAFSLETLFPNAGVDVRSMAVIGILINAAAQSIKVGNMILGGGILPSGSDVKGVILGDAIGAFVGVGLAVVLGLFTPLAIVGIFVARVIEETVKLVIFRARARKLSWPAVIAAHEVTATA